MPLMDLPHCMTVVRSADLGLAVFGSISLGEDPMSAPVAHGRPAYQVLAPEGARASPVEGKPRQVLRVPAAWLP
ncbi:hypothetical protein BurJ1DRAFT_3491 [Burkholderiales bacterium JOSHI_001]|nr:hypothetical protein BurJ1DRAFT_3491 [Burkholderiales bacterium JOSHI_001]